MTGETLIPTHGLRLYTHDSGATARLQQRFVTTAGAEVWRDVPKVKGHGEPWVTEEEQASPPPRRGLCRGLAQDCRNPDNDGWPCMPGCPNAAAPRREVQTEPPSDGGVDKTPRYTTKRLHDEIAKAREYGRQQAFEEMIGTTIMVIGENAFRVGDQVEKFTGDYTAKGEVRGTFAMKSGAIRHVVEHPAEGGGSFCHIYAPKNLRRAEG
jgi:hypothetical protein